MTRLVPHAMAMLVAFATEVAGQTSCALCDTWIEIDREEARCLAAAMHTHLAAAESGAARINLAECSGAIPLALGDGDEQRDIPVIPRAGDERGAARDVPEAPVPPVLIVLDRDRLLCLERLLDRFSDSDEEVFIADLNKSCK